MKNSNSKTTSLCLLFSLAFAMFSTNALAGTAPPMAAGELYFTTGGQPRFQGGTTPPGQINKVNLDGSGLTVIIPDTLVASGAVRPHGIAVDLIGEKIWYTNWRDGNNQGVHFANLDGTSPGSYPIGASPFFQTGIAIDNAGGKLYTTDSGGLFQANLDGTGAISLINRGFQKGEVELDLVLGHVYWTSGNEILRANLDGSGLTVILNTTFPRGLEVDAANNSIYFTTNGVFSTCVTTLERIDLDGMNRATLYSLAGANATRCDNFFTEVELDPAANQLYFANTVAGTISRINTDGTGLVDILSGLDTPDGLDLIADSDADDDGVPDGDDVCAMTPPETLVNADGCSIDQACPCDDPWPNHYSYVRCVANEVSDLLAEGLITRAEKRAIVRAARQSNCGSRRSRRR